MTPDQTTESDINKTESDKTPLDSPEENDKAPGSASDAPPPSMTIAGRGLLGQDVPDVTTGSTPLTRRDE